MQLLLLWLSNRGSVSWSSRTDAVMMTNEASLTFLDNREVLLLFWRGSIREGSGILNLFVYHLVTSSTVLLFSSLISAT